MLKEIDLAAFGRRVHIFNAIKQLRARIPQEAPVIPLSPLAEGVVHSSPFPTRNGNGFGLDQSAPGSPQFARDLTFDQVSPYMNRGQVESVSFLFHALPVVELDHDS